MKAAGPIRIKCTDDLGNVAYIYRPANGKWHCALANGIPATLSYAGILEDQMGTYFKLDDCTSAAAALNVVRESGSKNCSYEVV